jgi:acylphosphatase
MIREVVRVSGRVQAVGFRDRVLDIAESYQVAGTVRNLRAGDVLEIDVEGEPAEVERFVADVLAHPPTFARIEAVERTHSAPRNLKRFTRGATG